MGNFYLKWGGWFSNWGSKFLKSLYIVGRGVLTPLWWRPPIYIAYPLSHFQILSTSPLPLAPSHFPATSNPHATVLSVFLFLWLNGSSCHIWCATLLHDNMDLHMQSLGTLLPEGPWCVFYAFYATRHQAYWGLAHNVIFYWYSDLISHTCKHTHSTRRGQ